MNMYTEIAKDHIEYLIKTVISLFPVREREQLKQYYYTYGTTDGFHFELYRNSIPCNSVITDEDLDLTSCVKCAKLRTERRKTKG